MIHMKKYISYLRVSTGKQQRSGLGLAAQQSTIDDYIASHGGTVIESFTETASGADHDREQLARAILHCELKGAVLLVSHIDRLSRSLAFISTLQESKIRFVVASNPTIDDMTVQVISMVAQAERSAISRRVKDALQQAKKRGVVLGNPSIAKVRDKAVAAATVSRVANADTFAVKMETTITRVRDDLGEGASLRAIANELNGRGFCTRRGSEWTATAVNRVLSRIGTNNA